ncbi:MAG TPA: hypothetical protein VKZ98_02100, partial [Aquaticitalea sp.]|nr:hypothetical protein [Aquaticitalea sp.]
MTFRQLKPQIQTIVSHKRQEVDEKLYAICELLKVNVPHYNWVGFYFRNGDKEELKLGPYVGEPT